MKRLIYEIRAILKKNGFKRSEKTSYAYKGLKYGYVATHDKEYSLSGSFLYLLLK